MKRICIFVALAFLVTSVTPALAQQAPKKEDSLFKIIADTLKPGPGKEKNKLRKVEKISLFQDISDEIRDGSARAKQRSLRSQ